MTTPQDELIREARDFYCADGNGACDDMVERLIDALNAAEPSNPNTVRTAPAPAEMPKPIDKDVLREALLADDDLRDATQRGMEEIDRTAPAETPNAEEVPPDRAIFDVCRCSHMGGLHAFIEGRPETERYECLSCACRRFVAAPAERE